MSASKKNCEMPREAPAPSFFLKFSMSCSKVGLEGCFSGCTATEMSKAPMREAASTKFDRARIAVRMLQIRHADAAGRITAQRHHAAHARAPVIAQHSIHFSAARGDRGEVRGRLQRRFAHHARDSLVRAIAR
jgi:hypothetical protein